MLTEFGIQQRLDWYVPLLSSNMKWKICFKQNFHNSKCGDFQTCTADLTRAIDVLPGLHCRGNTTLHSLDINDTRPKLKVVHKENDPPKKAGGQEFFGYFRIKYAQLQLLRTGLYANSFIFIFHETLTLHTNSFSLEPNYSILHSREIPWI